MLQLTRKIIEADNEKLVCEFALKDKNAVILHGAGQATRQRYYAIAKELLKRGIGVILFDFSGHGESTGTLAELSLARRKRQATSVVNTLLPSESSFYLIGFSMGAQTVCDLLPDYGARVEAILLACPAAYRSDVQDLAFGEGAFTFKLREPESWRTTNSQQYLSGFRGRTVIAIGSNDDVIPRGVVALLKKSARHLIYKEYPGVSHALAAWLAENTEELAALVTALVGPEEAA